MAIQFKSIRINIPAGGGPKTIPGSMRFDSRVIKSEFMIGGFRFNFRSKDHHIDQTEIDIVRVGSIRSNPNSVLFNLECRYQDKNGDDSWDGFVDVVVIADVA